MKLCPKCKELKPTVQFNKNTRNLDGLSYSCRSCDRAYKKRRYHLGLTHKQRAEYAAQYRRTHKEQARAYQHNYRNRSPRATLWLAMRHALARRPSESPITIKFLMDLFEKQQGRCALSGVMMSWGRSPGQRGASVGALSIDRIDSASGYSQHNVRLTCHGLNTFRGSSSDEQMLALGKAYVAYQARSVNELCHSSESAKSFQTKNGVMDHSNKASNSSLTASEAVEPFFSWEMVAPPLSLPI